GGLATLDDAWRRFQFGPIGTGLLVLSSFTLINMLVSLPLSLYSTFGIEAEFGFNRTTARTYMLDLVKTLFVSALLALPLAWAALELMANAGEHWWLYVWALWFAFSLVLTWAYPVLIAPLFNKFSPLADESLKARIETLLTRCGFK